MERNKDAVWKPANTSQYIEALCLLKLSGADHEFVRVKIDDWDGGYCFDDRNLDQLEFRHSMVIYWNNAFNRFYIFYYTGNFRNTCAKRLRSKKEFMNHVLLVPENKGSI